MIDCDCHRHYPSSGPRPLWEPSVQTPGGKQPRRYGRLIICDKENEDPFPDMSKENLKLTNGCDGLLAYVQTSPYRRTVFG